VVVGVIVYGLQRLRAPNVSGKDLAPGMEAK
jgi:hypothetical protein